MDDDKNLSPFELIVMSLSVYITTSTIIQLTTNVNGEILKLLQILDLGCCGVFITEWLVRFKRSKKKLKFTLKNLIDLLASLPLDYISMLKSLRLIKLIKILGTFNRFISYYKANTVKVARFLLSLLFSMLILISPILILYFEQDRGTINTAENALWWTYCTITTIGYGDLYPVTTEGRIFTVLVSLGGIGMLGIGSGLLVNYVINSVNKHEKDKNNS